MRKFVMNCDDHYYDKENRKVYKILKGTEVEFVSQDTEDDILGMILTGEGKGFTIMFLANQLDEVK